MRKLVSLLVITLTSYSPATAQWPELISPLGASFYSQPDEKGLVAEAEKKLAASPKNMDLIIALGRAQGSVWRFRDAIATFTRGIELEPNNAMLYRHRGHRYISTRQFDKAIIDLEHGAALDSKSFDIWYHLGLAHYLKGDFRKAADAYEKCRAAVEKDDSLIAVSHWLYMAYRRDKRESEAAGVLDRITPAVKVEENKSYLDLLLFYKGLKNESEILAPEKLADLESATVGYGVANWHFYTGDRSGAKQYFRRIIEGKAWAAFGFIAAETELARI